MELEIKSEPSIKEGTVDFIIPLLGSLSIWLKDPIALPDIEGYHYNFNIPVGEFIELAIVSRPKHPCSPPHKLCPQENVQQFILSSLTKHLRMEV